MNKNARLTSSLYCSLLLTACETPQSTLAPAGASAEQIANLFWWMAGGAAIIWLAVIGLAVYAVHVNPSPHSEKGSRRLIVYGGIAVPVVVLAGLLGYGLSLMPKLMAPGDGLTISVTGEQWWWRVRYQSPDHRQVETANEIRLPVNERAEFKLASADVIHSFWIPSLGGKIDMIPGRENRLVLEPTRTGIFRGMCAEFCGIAHALMAFDVVVMERSAFDQWLKAQTAPAKRPVSDKARIGEQIFINNGCGACHHIAGTQADGVIGPDLTHVGSRLTIGAGTLPTTIEAFEKWTGHTDTVKPGVLMPAYGMLSSDKLSAIATYLMELK